MERPVPGWVLLTLPLESRGFPRHTEMSGLMMKQRCRGLAKRFDRNRIVTRAEAILKAVAENQSTPKCSR